MTIPQLANLWRRSPAIYPSDSSNGIVLAHRARRSSLPAAVCAGRSWPSCKGFFAERIRHEFDRWRGVTRQCLDEPPIVISDLQPKSRGVTALGSRFRQQDRRFSRLTASDCQPEPTQVRVQRSARELRARQIVLFDPFESVIERRTERLCKLLVQNVPERFKCTNPIFVSLG